MSVHDRIVRARIVHERETDRLAERLRHLPTQLDNARRKVAMLEREAARLGMHELLIDHPLPSGETV